MRKLFRNGAMAVLALALPLAALADNNLNLDTGATGSAGTGDITFDGASLTPVRAAMQFPIGTLGAVTFTNLVNEATIQATASLFSTAPITIASGNLAKDQIIVVHTNGGNYAKVLVTAVNSSSISLLYVTYNSSGAVIQGGANGATATLGGQTGPAAPTITMVQNNYSYILPSAPNYGIAPGTLLLILGTGMADPGSSATPLQDPTKALPKSLHGASVSVTVNGTTVQPAFYYAIPTALAVVLPSTTPAGTGTITVTYNGQPSAPAPITIVAHAFGFDYYGGALAAVTDNADGHLITASQSAHPGEVIVFWGAGDGADTKNDDVNPPTSYDILNGITHLYFGGVEVPIAYDGRSTYQGVDQVAVVVPQNAPTGCAVSVAAVSGSVVSNFVTIPIAANGGQCSDGSLTYVDPTLAGTLAGKNTVKFGGLSIDQLTVGSTTADFAGAFFYSISGYLLGGYQSSSLPSMGSCFVTQSSSASATSPYTETGLDAGAQSVMGPNGTQALSSFPGFPGLYGAQLPSGFVPPGGGNFTFTGAGGADVGAYTANLNFPSPLTWTNSASDGTVTRTQGVTVEWTGGADGTYVQISGDAATTGFSASFVCDAPVSAHSFTVPPAVLLTLPAGNGSLSVNNYTNPKSFTAPNLDFAFAVAFVSDAIDAIYQ